MTNELKNELKLQHVVIETLGGDSFRKLSGTFPLSAALLKEYDEMRELYVTCRRKLRSQEGVIADRLSDLRSINPERYICLKETVEEGGCDLNSLVERRNEAKLLMLDARKKVVNHLASCLTTKEAAVLALYYIHGITINAIAAATGVSVRSIYEYRRRALEHLEAHLQEEESNGI